MKKLKMYSTNLTTMDAELFQQIKILAAKLNKDQNDLLEEAAQDLIKKYEHKVSSLSFSNWKWGFVLNTFIYTGILILLIGWIGLMIFALTYQFEEDKNDKIDLKSLSTPKKHTQNHDKQRKRGY